MEKFKIVEKVEINGNFEFVEKLENVEWKDTPVPFCGIVDANWNQRIEKFLVDQQAYLGTAHYPRSGCDFFIKAPYRKAPHINAGLPERFLNIECKLWKSNVGQADAETIIFKLNRCDGLFNVILCAKFGALDFSEILNNTLDDKKDPNEEEQSKKKSSSEKLSREEKLAQFPTIYKLEWNATDDSFFLELKFESTTSEKVLFLIDLNTISKNTIDANDERLRYFCK